MHGQILDQRRVSLTGGGVYTIKLDYDASANPIYIGLALPGSSPSDALWQIRKLTFDAFNNVTDLQYANGSTEFVFAWTGRVALSYS